jgi:hypothetical protein
MLVCRSNALRAQGRSAPHGNAALGKSEVYVPCPVWHSQSRLVWQGSESAARRRTGNRSLTMMTRSQPLHIGLGAALASLAASCVTTLVLLGSQIAIAHHYDQQVQTAVAARKARRPALAAAPVDAAAENDLGIRFVPLAVR